MLTDPYTRPISQASCREKSTKSQFAAELEMTAVGGCTAEGQAAFEQAVRVNLAASGSSVSSIAVTCTVNGQGVSDERVLQNESP
jgi:hypothetical protein